MSVIAYIIVLFFVGLIVGGLGRLLLPGPDPLTLIQTVLVGLVASYTGGLFTRYVLGSRSGPGLIVSVLFAMLIVWLIRRYRASSWSQPGPPGPRRL